MEQHRIAVLGGTGFVGRTVCELLAEHLPGTALVVPTRQLAHARAIQMLPTVELAEADVHDERALDRLLHGCSAVVNLVAVLHGSPERFAHVHVALPRKLAAACTRAGVQRVVHVSALGVGAHAPSAYLRSKAEGEAVWHASGLPVVLLRPSVIFGADDRFTNLFARLLRIAPVLPLAGAHAQFQPVWVRDVAQAVVQALLRPQLRGQTLECAGPEVMTLAEVARRVGRMAGCVRPILPLPEPLARVQAALMALLPGEPLVSRDNLLSMRVPNVATGSLPGLTALGIRPAPLETLAPHFAPAGALPA